MENGTPVEVALIGDGRRGRLLCRVLAEMPRVRRIHLVSQRNARAMHDWLAAGRLAHRVELHAKLDPVLWNRDIAAAVVANQPAEHFATARWLLENGKHVLVEMPFAETRSEAQALIDMADARGLVAAAGLEFTAEPGKVTPDGRQLPQDSMWDALLEPLAAEVTLFLDEVRDRRGILRGYPPAPIAGMPEIAGEHP